MDVSEEVALELRGRLVELDCADNLYESIVQLVVASWQVLGEQTMQCWCGKCGLCNLIEAAKPFR